ncbi:MAG: FKBP-type peptidyl-prolyl cis-trans isomerase N-terminal domain-containing protein [Alistipes sp.]|nr:FKBP-type peptidyl-prolyl cis-trans isomerase N-terminal domain-containing protein [Candidatus Alistipes equi]
MKAYRIIIALFVTATALSCSSRQVELRNELDSLSYIFGTNVAENLLKMDSTLNVQAVCRGLEDTFNGNCIISKEEGRTYLLAQKTFFIHEKAKAYEEQFLADMNRHNREFAQTRSGITYKITKVGDQNSQMLTSNDTLKVIMTIKDIQGHIYKDCDTIRLSYRSLVQGVQEVVRMTGNGGAFDAWIPYEKAYDQEGNKELGIKPRTTLNYIVDILDIEYASQK